MPLEPRKKSYQRGAQPVRSFSAEEDRLITEWRVAGYGTTNIAVLLFIRTGIKRTQATINMRLKTLAVLEEGKD